MLSSLVKKQLLEMVSFLILDPKKQKVRSVPAIVFYVIVILAGLGIFAGIFGTAGNAMAGPLAETGHAWVYFALMGSFATALGVFGSVFMTYQSLYAAKDNELLLSMPIPTGHILFSRLLGGYIQSFFFEVLVLVPAEYCYMKTGYGNAASLFASVVVLLLLPLLALTLSMILGWLIAAVSSKTNDKNLVSVVISLVFLAVFYVIYFRASTYLQGILEDPDVIGGKIKVFLFPLYAMGRGESGEFLYLLIFAAIVLAFFFVVRQVLARSFVRLATSSRTGKKVKYVEKSLPAGSVLEALTKKELLHFKNSSVYMLNCSMGTIFMIAGTVFLLIRGSWVREMIGGISDEMPEMLSAFTIIAVCFLAASNFLTAPAISLEGRNLWILRSMPIKTRAVFASKVLLHVIVTLIPALLLITAAAPAIMDGPAYWAAGVILTAVFVLATGLLDLIFGLKFTNLNWKDEAIVVKQGFGVFLSMFANYLVDILIAFPLVALTIMVSFAAGFLAALVLLLILTFLTAYYLNSSGVKHFEDLL